VIAAGPADPLEARYQLARAMARAGDAAGARREILAVLESAPAFEKAQALLLELRGRTPEERNR
jgi:Tfp pilus assembly protein PilF